jgi:acyl dehydratase
MECPDDHAGIGWGILTVAPADPAAEARRAESLGFGHLAMPGADMTAVLLALGATRSLKIIVDEGVPLEPHLMTLPPQFQNRLITRPHFLRVTRVQFNEVGPPTDPRSMRHHWPVGAHLSGLVSECRTIVQEHVAGCLGRSTFELVGQPRDRSWMVSRLALDVLHGSAPFDGPLYAEDLTVGDIFDLGTWCPTEDEIVAFGERWDPLDLHIDPHLALDTPLGALCASGIHSEAIMQRLSARGFVRRVAVIAGRSMLGMRLHMPVVPDMLLTGRTEIIDVRLRPTGRAVVTIRSTLQHAENPVLELEGELVVEQRSRRSHSQSESVNA